MHLKETEIGVLGSPVKIVMATINQNLTMPFGRYKGIAVKKIPNSYLRWLLTVPSIPKIIREEAENKLRSSDFDSTDIQISRHAVDMFSKRFINKWADRKIGIGTFLAHMAIDAINKGIIVNDDRNIGKGISIYYDNIVWVFTWPKESPDFKSLITVMYPNNQIRNKVKNALK